MSWGERSCKECRAPEGYCSYETCNVDCQWYEWDGVTRPDTESCFKFQERMRTQGVIVKKEQLKPDFTGLKFCERCKAMKSKSHIKKCKKRKK